MATPRFNASSTNLRKECLDFARPFVDDIILISGGATYDEAAQNHVKHLQLALQRLREKKLAVSASKANHL